MPKRSCATHDDPPTPSPHAPVHAAFAFASKPGRRLSDCVRSQGAEGSGLPDFSFQSASSRTKAFKIVSILRMHAVIASL